MLELRSERRVWFSLLWQNGHWGTRFASSLVRSRASRPTTRDKEHCCTSARAVLTIGAFHFPFTRAEPCCLLPAPPQSSSQDTFSQTYRGAEWSSLTLRQACYQEYPGSAMCVQNLDDSRGLAIRITYRISLRSSSLWEPRHPSLKVVRHFVLRKLLAKAHSLGFQFFGSYQWLRKRRFFLDFRTHQ